MIRTDRDIRRLLLIGGRDMTAMIQHSVEARRDASRAPAIGSLSSPGAYLGWEFPRQDLLPILDQDQVRDLPRRVLHDPGLGIDGPDVE